MCQSHHTRQQKGGMTKISVEDAIGGRLAHDITEIRPGEFKDPSFRRGHKVQKQEVCRLMRLGKRHLYILDLNADQVHEDDAVVELATALAHGENRLLISKNKKTPSTRQLVAGCAE